MKDYLKATATVGCGIAAYLIFLIILGLLAGFMFRVFMIGFGLWL